MSMTAGELIKLLSKFPPDTLVVHEDEAGIWPAEITSSEDDTAAEYAMDDEGNPLPKGTIWI